MLPDNEAEIPHLSARQTYGLLALMARYVVPLMEGEDSDAGAGTQNPGLVPRQH